MMKTILLAIHPKQLTKIFAGEKYYEFRRVKPKQQPTKLIFYCTTPIAAVVGEAMVSTVLIETPTKLWQQTKDKSGSSKEDFFNYFENCDYGVAYQLEAVKEYQEKHSLSEYGLKKAPRSYVYLK